MHKVGILAVLTELQNKIKITEMSTKFTLIIPILLLMYSGMSNYIGNMCHKWYLYLLIFMFQV